MSVVNNSTRLLNILDNISFISDMYQQLTELDEETLEISKNTTIILNETSFSFYYLMKQSFNYINNKKIKIKLLFKIKKTPIENKIFFITKILILTGKNKCHSYNCSEYYCNNGYHYFHSKKDKSFTITNKNAKSLIVDVEKKVHDFNLCEECLNIWDMNTQLKQENDIKEINICSNCIMFNHLNKKTLKPEDECSICLKDIYCNNLIKTDCNHIFHIDCLNIWINEKETCPMCRKKISKQF
jgi:hypothetical protein